MTRRARGTVIASPVLAAVVAAELPLRRAASPSATVVVVHGGPEPPEDLVGTPVASRTGVAAIEPGGTPRVPWIGLVPQTLLLSDRQRDNPMAGDSPPGFGPARFRRDGSRLVGEVARYQEAEDPATPAGRAARRPRDWSLRGFGVEPDAATD